MVFVHGSSLVESVFSLPALPPIGRFLHFVFYTMYVHSPSPTRGGERLKEQTVVVINVFVQRADTYTHTLYVKLSGNFLHINFLHNKLLSPTLFAFVTRDLHTNVFVHERGHSFGSYPFYMRGFSWGGGGGVER